MRGSLVILLWTLCSFVGCTDEEERPSTNTFTLTLTDNNNYAFDPSIDIEAYPLRELTDILIDWSNLTTDLSGQSMDAAKDVDTVSLVVFRYATHEEIEDGLGENTIYHQPFYVFAETTGRTSIMLSELWLFGTDVDVETYFEEAYGKSWLLTLSTGDTPGVGTRMAAFLDPIPSGAPTVVYLDNDSTTIDPGADLRSTTPLRIPLHTPLTADWSEVTTDAQGDLFDHDGIDRIAIAHYPELTLEELEPELMVMEDLASRIWSEDDLSGASSAALCDLVDEAGNPFRGIDVPGTWLLSLHP